MKPDQADKALHNWVLTFVTYNPPTAFFVQLRLALNHGLQLIVLDNTPVLPEGFDEFEAHPGLKIIHNGKNLGLGMGLNILMKEALSAGFDYALYFDQDTLFTDETLPWINDWMHREGAFPQQYSAIGFTSEAPGGHVKGHIQPTKLLINNGTMFRLRVLEAIGFHNPNYFIECVDYRFCFDSAAKGYKLGIIGSCPGIDHHSLQPEEKVSFIGRNISFRTYPQARSKAFLGGLFGLTMRAARKGMVRFAWIFLRNILTFLVTQSWFRLLRIIDRKSEAAKPNLQLGIVVYGQNNPFHHEIEKLSGKPKPARIFIVNNLTGAASGSEIVGDNTHFEFSAYLQLAKSFNGEGPFIIVNDTLFRTHWTGGWTRLLKKALKSINQTETALYGDIRRDGDAIHERPDPFLASWLFFLPNRGALIKFTTALESILSEPLPAPSPAYEAYLQWWTNPRRRFRGWHGDRSAAGIQRKVHCIRLEHALSKALTQQGLPLRSLGAAAPVLYTILRITDRLRTALSRLA